MINLNPSNVTKWEVETENTSNTKSNLSIQQNKHKQSAFIAGDSMVKNIDSYLLTGPIKKKKIVVMQDYIKLTKRDFDLSLYILHVGTNDLALENIPEAKFKQIIATAENLKKEHNKVAIYRCVGLI